MKKLLGLIVLFLLSINVFAQEGAKIEFKTETINYGEVVKGEDSGVREFVFTNTGDAPLVIKKVNSSCGCTVAEKPDAPIMPGKSDKIVVKYNMNPGPISKTVTVETNAVNKPNGVIPLRIKGTVIVKKDK
ncbi:DUF1573 domain-containing protein [Flavobacterium sp. NRK F10]|uniref:DUF1573 domain-containing protein n=1 Tax=Flavobacterium sediminis TaxID=2201181 RepID=A0A2U8QYC9_9FLAO|nr:MULTISPECIES: DUF1573 domain-containing protein [Flavobacterium]AWM15227.1 hypothetical protein DI487_01140 [Flavobacterium sediminis]MCO6173723.1 DUF1573 domain-containing protein [Flavobacterium sp. NRK F10]